MTATTNRTAALQRHILAVVTVGTMVLVGLVGMGRVASSWGTWNMLHEAGMRTQAVVIEKRDTLPLLSTFYLTYEYDTADGSFTRETQVNRREYRATELGDGRTVLYDPQNPDISVVEDDNTELLTFTLTTFAWLAAAALSGGLYIWFNLRLARARARQRDLYDQAAAALGEIAAQGGSPDAAPDDDPPPGDDGTRAP